MCNMRVKNMCVFVGAQQYDDIPPPLGRVSRPPQSALPHPSYCCRHLLDFRSVLPFFFFLLSGVSLYTVSAVWQHFVCSWLSLSTTTTTTNMCIHLYLALLCAGGCWPPSGGSTGGIYVGIHRQLLPLLWWHFLYIVTLDSENKTNNVEAKPTTATTHSQKQEEES